MAAITPNIKWFGAAVVCIVGGHAIHHKHIRAKGGDVVSELGQLVFGLFQHLAVGGAKVNLFGIHQSLRGAFVLPDVGQITVEKNAEVCAVLVYAHQSRLDCRDDVSVLKLNEIASGMFLVGVVQWHLCLCGCCW